MRDPNDLASDSESAYSTDNRASSLSLSTSNNEHTPKEVAISATKEVSLKIQTDKIKIESSIRRGLEDSKAPLLAYFKKCSPEEYQRNLARDQQMMEEEADEACRKKVAIKQQILLQKREQSMYRQRRHRERKREKEIQEGVRSPDGRKRKIVLAELTDSSQSKKPRITMPEETRPARLLERRFKEKIRKVQGRKEKHKARHATNHNWFTPVCWRLIEEAAQIAGWKMSASEIVHIAKARNKEIFKNLSRETVRDWIDRKGAKPRWSDGTMRRIEAANAPGHRNGGPVGALVSKAAHR
jgi:hypothetical protein